MATVKNVPIVRINHDDIWGAAYLVKVMLKVGGPNFVSKGLLRLPLCFMTVFQCWVFQVDTEGNTIRRHHPSERQSFPLALLKRRIIQVKNLLPQVLLPFIIQTSENTLRPTEDVDKEDFGVNDDVWRDKGLTERDRGKLIEFVLFVEGGELQIRGEEGERINDYVVRYISIFGRHFW